MEEGTDGLMQMLTGCTRACTSKCTDKTHSVSLATNWARRTRWALKKKHTPT